MAIVSNFLRTLIKLRPECNQNHTDQIIWAQRIRFTLQICEDFKPLKTIFKKSEYVQLIRDCAVAADNVSRQSWTELLAKQ